MGVTGYEREMYRNIERIASALERIADAEEKIIAREEKYQQAMERLLRDRPGKEHAGTEGEGTSEP